jgi:hypothetical protein
VWVLELLLGVIVLEGFGEARRNALEVDLGDGVPGSFEESHLVLAERQQEERAVAGDEGHERLDVEAMGNDHHLVQSRRHAVPPKEPGSREDREPVLLIQPEVGVLQELEGRRQHRARLGRPRSGRKYLTLGRPQEVLEADRVLARFRDRAMGRQVDRDRGRRDGCHQPHELVERECGHDRSPLVRLPAARGHCLPRRAPRERDRSPFAPARGHGHPFLPC